MAYILVCISYLEMPQKVTNVNAITLVYYLAQQKTVLPHVILQMG